MSAFGRSAGAGSSRSFKGPTSRPLSEALAIDRETQNWTVLVQVLERHPPKDSRTDGGNRNGIRYRNYVVTDMKGTKVGIATYANNIKVFEDTLIPYRRYYISNAGVTHCQHQYRLGPYMYSWNLYKTTPVDPYEEDTIPRFPCTFDVIRFSDFYSHADRDEAITVTALVVQAFPEIRHHKELVSTDYVLISQEKLPILFRVWNNPLEQYNIELWQTLPQPLLIVARNVKVTTYHGLSLSTRYNTYILEDPSLIDEHSWKSWYELNHAEVTYLVVRRTYRDISKMFKPPLPSEIIPIETARTAMENNKTSWVRGQLNMIPGQGKLWYTCCKFCNKAYTSGDDWELYCTTCKEWAPIQLRCHIGVQIGDDTGSMEVKLFTPEVEKLIPFTATEIKAADDNEHPVHDEIEEIIGNKLVYCFVKYFDKEVKRSMVRRYPVLRLYTEDEMPQVTAPTHPLLPMKESTSTSTTTDTPTEIHEPVHTTVLHTALTITPTTEDTRTNIPSSPEHNKSTPDMQVLSPMTKVLLKDISAVTNKPKDTNETSSGVKRILSFSPPAVKKEKVAAYHTTRPSPTNEPHTDQSGKESPQNKLKDKLKMP